MKLIVFGATGGTGREIIAQALEQGHEVAAFVRDPARLAATHARLRIIQGSVEGEAAPLAAALRGQDAVISALGVGQSFKPGGLMARAAAALVPAMESEGVRRLIFTSAVGVQTRAGIPLVPRLFMGTLLRAVYADKALGEDRVSRSSLDWTIVQPTGLTNGPRTGRCRHGERLALRGLPSISRADTAHFILQQLGDAAYVRKSVVISD